MDKAEAPCREMLMKELESWQNAHDLAVRAGAEEVVVMTRQQIEKISRMLQQ